MVFNFHSESAGLRFSIIIPVYNRPEELDELLQSIVEQEYEQGPEVIVIEDGSSIVSKSVVDKYTDVLEILYLFKMNSGPGDSRNYGMQRASGTYFILLDSDCILPVNYLSTLAKELTNNYTDAYGGPDVAHDSFSNWQKAINYSMTSVLTTGGLRSAETSSRKFQLRSFNMGLSKKAFDSTGGFSRQRIGEDIDLNFKLLDRGFSTRLIPEVFVYHKRRSTLTAFFRQTKNFGAARPVLNRLHKGTAKWSYWFPSLFLLGSVLSVGLWYVGIAAPLYLLALYWLAVFINASVMTKNVGIGILSVLSTLVQFTGYGLGFLRTVYRLNIQKMSPREAFPLMFR